MTRGEIQLLQLALKADGFNPGPLDGYFGRRTSIAVNAYELYYGIDVSPYLKVYFATLKHMDIGC
jgi:peptidoglycan hydrolase-like protein with peptidoglycan-binding domain